MSVFHHLCIRVDRSTKGFFCIFSLSLFLLKPRCKERKKERKRVKGGKFNFHMEIWPTHFSFRSPFGKERALIEDIVTHLCRRKERKDSRKISNTSENKHYFLFQFSGQISIRVMVIFNYILQQDRELFCYYFLQISFQV